MAHFFPFTPEHFLGYSYRAGKHFLGNGVLHECATADVRAELECLVNGMEQHVVFIVPTDADSRLELQLAFEGNQVIKLGDKLVWLYR